MNSIKTSQAISLTDICDYFVQAFPANNKDKQTLALALYRLLSHGNPVKLSHLKNETGLTDAVINKILNSWSGIYFNNKQQVTGFWGMTIEPTTHCILVDENVCYTWCAWDTLFIPELLDKTVRVQSRCPVTDNNIELVVTPKYAQRRNDKPLYLSFLQPDMQKLQDDITVNFCHFVHFFGSKKDAEHWLAEHPGTVLLTLDQGFEIAKQVNNARFNLAS